jgi:hypothetical protein
MSTLGRHIKSYEQVQSLIHEPFMKIRLKFLKGKSWMGGKGEENEHLNHLSLEIRERILYVFPPYKCQES